MIKLIIIDFSHKNQEQEQNIQVDLFINFLHIVMNTTDMQKHPRSLVRLAEIFVGIGGNAFKLLPLLCVVVSGKGIKLR